MTHQFHATALREYDIRGIVGDTLTEADAWAIGRSFATIVRRAGGKTVAIGYDGRLSSPMLEAALIKGLSLRMAAGAFLGQNDNRLRTQVARVSAYADSGSIALRTAASG